jgi:hypothetical protein
MKRMVDDTETLNIASKQFFTLLNDVFREVGLVKLVPILPKNTINAKKKMLSTVRSCQELRQLQ